LDGPGEVLFVFLGSGLLHTFHLLDPVWALAVDAMCRLDAVLATKGAGLLSGLAWPCEDGLSDKCDDATRALYVREVVLLAAYAAVVLKITASILWLPKAFHSSRVWLLLTLFVRAFPALAVLSGLYSFGGDWTETSSGADTGDAEGGRAGWWAFWSQPSRGQGEAAAVTAAAAGAGGGMGCGVGASSPVFDLSLCGSESPLTVGRVLLDGMFVSIITSELIVAKMADRQIHPLLVVLALASVAGPAACLGCLVLYYGSVFWDLCNGLNLPLLNPVLNVYCDGVFDLLHVGHMKQFQAALKCAGGGGAKLLVGVHGDAECTEYKRRPVMNEQERYAAVRACAGVSEVIERAPLKTDVAFLKKHKIHLVACGEEYFDDPNDTYYTVPRALGILHPTPRTPGVSTSEIIRRVKALPPDKAAKQTNKNNGDKAAKPHPLIQQPSRTSAW